MEECTVGVTSPKNWVLQIHSLVDTRSFPVRHLVDVCVVRMFMLLSFNEDAGLIR